jgi:hypothetical protein
MKKHIYKLTGFYGILALLVLSVSVSCRKYDSLGFTPGKGAPVITSVHTLSRTDTTSHYDTVYAYDASGNITKTIKRITNRVEPFDSVTTAGNLGQYYVIQGANLGSATVVSFNGVSAYFNRAWMTDQSIIVQIPTSVPTLGPEATDTLSVTTLYGTANYKFVSLTPPPTVNLWSDYDFWEGSQITLTGVGFATVTAIGLTGTTQNVTIVSQTDKQLVLKFPATTVNRAHLVFSYNSSSGPTTLTSTQELIDLDNAYTIFYKSDFKNTWFDNSWSHPSGTSTEATHSTPGTASIRANYPAGGWQIEGWAGWNSPDGGLPYDPDFKYLTFWVKGGTVDHTLVLVGEKMTGGYGQVQNANAMPIQLIPAPKGVWTYYKIPLGTGAGQLNYWATGSPAQQLGFFLQGQDGDVDEVMYFDEVAFVK